MLKLPARKGPEIQFTSFVDLFFNLLAFMLVVGSLEQAAPAHLQVELPRPRMTAAHEEIGQELKIVLDKEEHMRANGRLVSEAELAGIIRQSPSARIATVIWADRRLPYERVVAILALVRESGGRRIKLAVLPE